MLLINMLSRIQMKKNNKILEEFFNKMDAMDMSW